MLNCLRLELSHKPYISFAEFMGLALYDEQEGYYARQKTRVGRLQDTDFYTAQSLQAVFYPLVLESIETLLDGGLKDYTFIEVGAEGDHPLPDSLKQAFKGVVRYGCNTILQERVAVYDKAVLFSNELFDAQPFHKLVYKDEKWQELGLRLSPEETLEECVLPELSKALEPLLSFLPKTHLDNYYLDLSIEANHVLKRMLGLTQKGLFLGFDYGYSWQELLYQRPQGTARAYYRHSLSDKLLERPGEQDLTYHVCWDFLIQVLKDHGYSDIQLKTQEAFFMQQALKTIKSLVEVDTTQVLNPRLQSLKELIHPQHMGHKFQVLCARKG